MRSHKYFQDNATNYQTVHDAQAIYYSENLFSPNAMKLLLEHNLTFTNSLFKICTIKIKFQ